MAKNLYRGGSIRQPDKTDRRAPKKEQGGRLPHGFKIARYQSACAGADDCIIRPGDAFEPVLGKSYCRQHSKDEKYRRGMAKQGLLADEVFAA